MGNRIDRSRPCMGNLASGWRQRSVPVCVFKDPASEIELGGREVAGLLSVHDGFERSSMIRASGGCLGTERR